MNKNTKKIATLVLSAIVAGALITASNADFSKLSYEERTEFRTLMEKAKSWTELTIEEQAIIDEVETSFRWNKWNFMWNNDSFKKGHNGWMKGLTDEEKTSLESMTDEEKKAFYESKKVERLADIEAKRIERKAHEAVIDKLLAWEVLTEEQEIIRSEIIIKRAERKNEIENRQANIWEMKWWFGWNKWSKRGFFNK